MGTLYARVDGAWVPVVAPAPPPALDEVWVGPSQPTAPETELWVDSDLAPAPMLFAKIGGTWTQVSAPPTNEVAVQAADPGGNVELWYDTDAPGYTTDDLRWQSAWGVQAFGTMIADNTTVTANTVMATLTASTVSGRRYRLAVAYRALGAAAGGGTFENILTQESTQIGGAWLHCAGNYENFSQAWYLTGDGSSHTWTIKAQNNSAAIQVYTSQGGSFVLEDVGPVPGSATQPPPAGGLPAGMKVYGPFTTGNSPSYAPQVEGTFTHTHNLNLPDTSKCVVSAMAMDGSWAHQAGWRVTPLANGVNFTIINQFAVGSPYNVMVNFRYMLFVGA
jgi:hypothetical protein